MGFLICVPDFSVILFVNPLLLRSFLDSSNDMFHEKFYLPQEQ